VGHQVVVGRAIRRPIRTGFARAEDLDHFFSAFIGRLAGIRGGGLGSVVGRNGYLDARPLTEDAQKAGGVFDDLPGVLAAQITPEARLPKFARLVD
jgi:hypothetical protein